MTTETKKNQYCFDDDRKNVYRKIFIFVPVIEITKKIVLSI